jgi:hypothetical protein
MPLVSATLGNILASRREPLLAVLNRLYDQLGNHADRYRSRRDPNDPDLFDYVLYLADDQNDWHTFRFSVDDRQATGFLFVVAVSHRQGKLRI